MWAVVNDAIEISQGQAVFIGLVAVVVHSVVFRVLLALSFKLLIEMAPSHRFVIGHHNLVEISLAHWALLVFQN